MIAPAGFARAVRRRNRARAPRCSGRGTGRLRASHVTRGESANPSVGEPDRRRDELRPGQLAEPRDARARACAGGRARRPSGRRPPRRRTAAACRPRRGSGRAGPPPAPSRARRSAVSVARRCADQWTRKPPPPMPGGLRLDDGERNRPSRPRHRPRCRRRAGCRGRWPRRADRRPRPCRAAASAACGAGPCQQRGEESEDEGAPHPHGAAPRVRRAGDRRRELRLDVPGEEDPGVLADLGDEGVDQRPPRRLGIDRGEMRLGQHLAHGARGVAGIDQIVDDEQAGRRRPRSAFSTVTAPCGAVVIARDAHRIDEADIELARDDRRRHQPAARHRDDAVPRPELEEPPGERPRMAVQLVPGDGKCPAVDRGGDHGHGTTASRRPRPSPPGQRR